MNWYDAPFARLQQTAVLLGVMLAACGPLAPGALAARADLTDLEDEVMCVQCKRPLSTSSGRAADDQRQLMQQWIDGGLTKPQVKARLVAEYGDRVLVDDRSTIAAAAPWLTALVGATSIGVLLRRRRTTDGPPVVPRTDRDDGQRGASEPPLPSVRTLSDAEAARLDAELAARD
jgi:cytochrome c-type biogenesis protein CcmH/NrfF